MKVIASGLPIKLEEFEKFSLDTANHFVKLYSWYYMPSSIHKLLIHGKEIIQHHSIIPIGNLSEDAQEARHKECRRFREHNTRKIGRKQTMEDLFHMLLITSDPCISKLRHFSSKSKQDLPQEALCLVHMRSSNLNENSIEEMIESDEENAEFEKMSIDDESESDYSDDLNMSENNLENMEIMDNEDSDE